jgi:pimeloyl-ACP methyl ester carboxylesterase
VHWLQTHPTDSLNQPTASRARGNCAFGALSSSAWWDSLEPLLAKRYRVINYSRRFAFPNRPASRDDSDPLSQHAADLVALVETLRLGKMHLVGNSSGAFVCLLAAQQRPDLARTLTLEEPPVVSMFLQALPPKPGELFKLLFSSPGALVLLVKFGAGTIGPATKAFQDGNDGVGLEIFARGVLGAAAFAKTTPARRQQMLDNVMAHRAALLGAVATDQQQDDVCRLQLTVDFFFPALARYDLPVVPLTDQALPLDQPQRGREVIAKPLVLVRIRVEDCERLVRRHHSPPERRDSTPNRAYG